MAREVIIRMSDDFDRSQAADEVIEFTYQGVTYTVDLTTEHADEFRAAIKPYQEAAHEAVRLTKEGKPSKKHGSQSGMRKAKWRSPVDEPMSVRVKLREWARANDMPTMDRGIVSDAIRQAYSEATGIPVALNVKLRADEVAMDQMELIAAHEPAHIQEGRQVIARQEAKEASAADKAFKAAVEKLPKPAPVENTKAAKKAPKKATRLAPDEPNANGVTQEMRDWARAHGHNIKHSNGYVPRELRDQFHAEKAASRNGALV